MDPYMTELFGRGSREGLLHWLRDGTLVINNVHKVCHVPSSAATPLAGINAGLCCVAGMHLSLCCVGKVALLRNYTQKHTWWVLHTVAC